jgi:hypothetical protein
MGRLISSVSMLGFHSFRFMNFVSPFQELLNSCNF